VGGDRKQIFLLHSRTKKDAQKKERKGEWGVKGGENSPFNRGKRSMSKAKEKRRRPIQRWRGRKRESGRGK